MPAKVLRRHTNFRITYHEIMSKVDVLILYLRPFLQSQPARAQRQASPFGTKVHASSAGPPKDTVL